MQTKTPGSAKALVRCPFCDTLNRVEVARADRPRCGVCKRPLLLDRPVRITDRDFDRIITESDVPILVDFYADWCGPCRIMAPVLDEVARENTGRLLVAKLDTDRNPGVASRFGITGIPTLIIFSGGEEAVREVGALPAPRLRALVQEALGRS